MKNLKLDKTKQIEIDINDSSFKDFRVIDECIQYALKSIRKEIDDYLTDITTIKY